MAKILKKEIGRLLYIRNLHPVTGSSSCSCLVHSLQSHRYDKDLNATGEPKKAHWHVIVVYGSPTTESNVKSLTERLNALNRFHWNKFEGIIAI